jgi:hypothetical protein
MNTITQNCTLYLAYKMAMRYKAARLRWRQFFRLSKTPNSRGRTVRAPKDVRRLHLLAQ